MNELLRLLRETPTEELLHVEHLEEQILPKLGFAADSPHLYPDWMRSRMGGLQSWQFPAQFAPYLALMSGMGVNSYLEIGVRHGGTFIITLEYLRRFFPIERALAIDINDCPAIRQYIAENGADYESIEFHKLDSHSPEAAALLDGRFFDLALIDGDHGRKGFRQDLDMVLGHTSSWVVALHDADNDGYPWIREYWLNSPSRWIGFFGQQAPSGNHGGIALMRPEHG